MARIEASQIEIGTPVTIAIGSDCYPYEVVGVRGGNVTVRGVTPVNCESWDAGCATTEYESNPNGEVLTLSSRGSHGWHVVGDYRSPCYGWCRRVMFGIARNYRDPSF